MTRVTMDAALEALATETIDAAYHLFFELGPGLLESVYERLLEVELVRRGVQVVRQHPVDFTYRGQAFAGGFRVDLLVEGRLVVEVKVVDALGPVASRQVLTYLRLMSLPLGLVINFGSPRFTSAVRRVENRRSLGVAPATATATATERGKAGRRDQGGTRRRGSGALFGLISSCSSCPARLWLRFRQRQLSGGRREEGIKEEQGVAARRPCSA
jgi:GxxExxY protein